MMTRSVRGLASALVLFALLTPLCVAADTAAIEGEITRLERAWNDAYGANDLPKYFSYYSADPILVFYEKRTTLADYRKLWTQTIKTEPIESAKLADLKVRVGPSGDAVVASYQLEVRTRHPDGKSTSEHAFETDIWLKNAGEWRICAVHYSTTPPPK